MTLFKDAFKESVKTRIRKVIKDSSPHTHNLVGGILRNTAAECGGELADQIIDELELQDICGYFKRGQ